MKGVYDLEDTIRQRRSSRMFLPANSLRIGRDRLDQHVVFLDE